LLLDLRTRKNLNLCGPAASRGPRQHLQSIHKRDPHIVHKNLERHRNNVQVQLETVGELVAGSRRSRRVSDVECVSHTVDRQGIVVSRVCRPIIVILGHDMMPGAGGEVLQRNTCALPLFGVVVEYAPLIASILGLPGKVVQVPIEPLLALELDRLWSVLQTCRYVKIELIAQ
jgi:hypothetical protein